ncbi:MAG: hybrid sensor histidine kinase/response regulator [Phycisphaerae bacterium]|nr:hybrid sensor histidine kinase/response regulator [Phycisphaerae bacterium]
MEVLNILAVDDEPGMLKGIERVLRDTRIYLPQMQIEVGFHVTTAQSGEEAIEAIGQSCPDILLLDHKLPGITGLEVLEQIVDKKDEIRTIMITAYASVDTAVIAIKRGAYDFLSKPFTPSELKTTVRKAAQSLIHTRQALNLAREKRQVRFEFISVLAHELKAPIAAIKGYLDIVTTRAAGDDQAVYDQMLDRCSIRLEGMRKMILDLLDLTHIESGNKNRELSEVNLAEIARCAMETVAPLATEMNVMIHLHSDDAVMMIADSSEIEIIFNNLISNAVKYNKPDGTVDITIEPRRDDIRITVTDTGIGMSTEETQRLFSEFVRIKNAQTRKILGSGLGLSILKKLACMYGGDATVTSQEGKGSTFTVTLKKTHDQLTDDNPRNNLVAEGNG